MGKGTQTTTQTSTPWSEQIPYLTYGMKEAKNLYKQDGPSYYPGSTVAGFAPEQQQAFGLGAQRALGGNDTMKAAEGYTQDVLAGKYMNNPYQDQVFNNIQQRVMPAVNSQFMGAGRYGSNAQTDTATRALTEAYSPYASQNWQFGQNQMMGAAAQAPTFAANDYTDLAALEAIGGQRQNLAQRELGDAVNRWNYQQQLPYDKLGQYLGSIGGNYGGTIVGKTPSNQPGLLQSILGGGLGLLGLFG